VPEVIGRPSRLRALAEIEANAESAANALDRIAATACRVMGVPAALVNLVGADRQRFIGCGTSTQPWAAAREMPIDVGFCPFTIAADAPMTVADAPSDPRWTHDPAVTDFGVVAYAGVPLRSADGEAIGTMCAVDERPRQWSEDDLALLGDLAASAAPELQLLVATRRAAQAQARLDALAALSGELAAAQTAEDTRTALQGAARRAGAAG
jgi:GAF domain-containing protein